MNEFQLVGNVVRTFVGENVATVTLAVRRSYKAKDAEEYATDFFTTTFFDDAKFAFIEGLVKGQSMSIVGNIKGERPRKDTDGFEDQQLIGRTLSFANGGNSATFQIDGSIGRVFENGERFATAKIYKGFKYNGETIYDTFALSVSGVFAGYMLERDNSKQGITVTGAMTTYIKEVTEGEKTFNKTFLVLNQDKTSFGLKRNEEDTAAEAAIETNEEKPKATSKTAVKKAKAEEVEAEAKPVSDDDLPF